MIISRIIIIKFNDHQQYMAAILISMMVNVMFNVILIAMISDIVKVPLSQSWIKFSQLAAQIYHFLCLITAQNPDFCEKVLLRQNSVVFKCLSLWLAALHATRRSA